MCKETRTVFSIVNCNLNKLFEIKFTKDFYCPEIDDLFSVRVHIRNVNYFMFSAPIIVIRWDNWGKVSLSNNVSVTNGRFVKKQWQSMGLAD